MASKEVNKYLYNDIDIERKKKIRKILLIFSLAIYILFNILWIIFVRIPDIGDNGAVCDIAKCFYYQDGEMLNQIKFYANLPISTYMQMYHQQIPLAFLFSMIYRIVNIPYSMTLRVLNVAFNILTITSIYLINKQLSKKYKVNKVLLFTLILTFIPIPMISTFVYGDIPSLALCLFSAYFTIKYVDSDSKRYIIFAAIASMLAYMFRMNSLIFVIASVIYLILNLFNQITKRTCKENILKILVIIGYIVITIIPSGLVKNYYLAKYDLDTNKEYPNESYLLMAMEEGPRGNGWYNEARGEYALKNPEIAKDEYREKIKERLDYFSKDIGYVFGFYTMKIASMWTENTYAAVRVNSFGEYEELENMTEPLLFYQKALLIITCLCSLIVLVQNRKNVSYEVIFLVTIFIGGFLFHILWEAKSRYIIPYIVILIPIAAINISKLENKYITKIKEKIQLSKIIKRK